MVSKTSTAVQVTGFHLLYACYIRFIESGFAQCQLLASYCRHHADLGLQQVTVVFIPQLCCQFTFSQFGGLGGRIEQSGCTAERYRRMYPTGAQVQLPVQAVCSALTHLFSLVATYATRHKVLREIRSTLLAEAHLSPCSSGDAAKDRQASVKTLKQMHDERADDGQRLKSQIRRSRVIWPGCVEPCLANSPETKTTHLKTVYIAVALAELFTHIATDAPLMRGLQQQGELAWCINEHSPKQLASSLTQITASRALPITAIQDVQRAFALTQAREIKETLLCLKAHLSCSLTLPKPACCVSWLLMQASCCIGHWSIHGHCICVRQGACITSCYGSGQ